MSVDTGGSQQSRRGAPSRRRLTWHYFLPGLQRLKHYDSSKARSDSIAGMVVAVLLIPQAVAYAQLAGLSPAAGLNASMAPLLIYALMGAQAKISIGPVALVSILIAEATVNVEGMDAAEAATLLTAMIAIILVIVGLFRLGFLVRVISQPVITGFTAAAAVLIATSQLGSMLGIELERGNLWVTVQGLLAKVDQIHGPTLLLSLAALLLFLLGDKPWQRLVEHHVGDGTFAVVLSKIAPLVVILLMMLGASLFDLASRFDIAMVGALDAGLPLPTLPPIKPEAALALVPSAIAIAAIIFVIANGIGEALRDQDDEGTTPDREAIAIGAANGMAALTSGYAVGASFSRSSLASRAGSATPFNLVVTALCVVAVVLLAGKAFAWLPSAVLGALIVSAVWSLIDVTTMKRVWHFSRAEAMTLIVTLLGVLFTNLQIGIAIGAIAGTALFLYGTSRPRITVEGQLADSDVLRSVDRDDVESEIDSASMIVGIDESLYFGNTAHVTRCIQNALQDRPACRHVLLDMKSVDAIDYTALQTLESLIDSLARRDIDVRLIAARRPVWSRLQAFGIVERCGGASSNHDTAQSALDALKARA